MTTMTGERAVHVPLAPPDPGLAFRRFRGVETDVPGMFEARAAALLANGEVYSGDVGGMTAAYRHLERCDPVTDILIAERDGRIVGYSRVEWQDTNDGERWYVGICLIEPGSRRQGIGRVMLDWSERQRIDNARRHRGSVDDPGGRPSFLTTSVMAGDPGATTLVESLGYEPFRTFFTMRRPTLDDIAEAAMPDGLEIRPIPAVAAEMRRVFDADHEAFRDHFGWAEGGDETFAAILEDPSTDPALWVVAFDGDHVAGAILNGLHPRPGEPGATDPWLDSVFTSQRYRRRGLARALMAHSLRLLRDLGHDRAYLGVDASNANDALGLYRSAGFEIATSERAYRKPLAPGRDG